MAGKVKKVHPHPFVLSDAETKELREGFNMFDKNGSGSIDSMEVRVALRVLGFDAPDEEVQDLLQKFNPGGASEISFDEFTQIIVHKLSYPQPEPQLLRAFHFLDKDGDGWISLQDLTQDAEELDEVLDVDELREIVMSARRKANQFDIHTKDVGKISESDFVAAIMRLYL
jgi:Ca2+-binding EF-hand superfamily protein